MDAGLFTANNVWMMLATALVFFMHTGFAFLEIGLTRQKNTINILFKNIFIITVGLLLYYAWGFNMMYPGFEEGSAGIFQFSMDSFGIGAPEERNDTRVRRWRLHLVDRLLVSRHVRSNSGHNRFRSGSGTY